MPVALRSAPMMAPSPHGSWLASLPFAPEIVAPTIRHLGGLKLGDQARRYGFKRSFNQTFRVG